MQTRVNYNPHMSTWTRTRINVNTATNTVHPRWQFHSNVSSYASNTRKVVMI